jgi:hypothetical protein
MKKILTCLMLLCFVVPCLADDTIYCPANAREREKQCKLAKEENKQIDETIQNWEPMLNDGNMAMYQITRDRDESQAQYTHRVKSMKSFYYQGLDYPVRGKFTRKGVTFIPLTYQESESVLSRAFSSRREVIEQMGHVRNNTQKVRPLIRDKIARLEKDRQRNTLYLAQCCGYRWTTEGPPQSTGKPYQNNKPKPDAGTQRGLLGEEAEQQRH